MLLYHVARQLHDAICFSCVIVSLIYLSDLLDVNRAMMKSSIPSTLTVEKIVRVSSACFLGIQVYPVVAIFCRLERGSVNSRTCSRLARACHERLFSSPSAPSPNSLGINLPSTSLSSGEG